MLTLIIGLIISSHFCALALYNLPDTPTKQCSAGASSNHSFLLAWSIFGVVIAILIFGKILKVIIIALFSAIKLANGEKDFSRIPQGNLGKSQPWF